jgi:DNA-binding MarR family transcriptional regulator
MFTEQQTVASDLCALFNFVQRYCMGDMIDALSELDLSLTQVKLLLHLENAEERLNLKDVAGKIPVSLPAASRAVEELHSRGLVTRTEDPTDRRMKRVEVTAAGRELTRRIGLARLHGLEQFAATLDAEERAGLQAALTTLMQRDEIAACRPTLKGDHTA